jgi:hypothetical protein
MKNIYILLIILIFSVRPASSQKVDNIKVEKSGNIVNIRYQIPNSNSRQVFIVTVLCSVNGGVDEVLRSVSGDVGDHIVGGKSEYSVYWDVLRDKDEVKSAEFIVRIKLIADNSANSVNPVAPDTPVTSASNKKINDTGFDRKRFNVLTTMAFQGPKYGAMFGFLGNWGIYLDIVVGETTKSSDADSNANPLTIPSFPVYSCAITKRIYNQNAVQAHLALGIANSQFVFYQKINTMYSFTNETLVGPEFGIVVGVKGGSLMLTYSQFDPSSVEQDSNMSNWSTLRLVTLGFGVRFGGSKH